LKFITSEQHEAPASAGELSIGEIMEKQELELTEIQMLADIHNMLSDIHEAMFIEDELEGDEAELEGDEAELEEPAEAAEEVDEDE
jgi:hypothetical protein